MKFIIGRITISFFFNFSDKNAKCSAAVPLEHVNANLDFRYFPTSFSNLDTYLPLEIISEFKALITL